MDYLTLIDIYNFGKTCKFLARRVFNLSLTSRRNVMCYHTKMTFEDTVLGVGVVFTTHEDGYAIPKQEFHFNFHEIAGLCTNFLLRQIKSIAAPTVDLLSVEAFDLGVRKGIWGESFSHFLPVILSPKHARQSVECAPRFFSAIMRSQEDPLSST